MPQTLLQFNGTLSTIRALTSHRAALRLVRYFGGQRLVFPLNPRPDHRVAIIVGRRHFAALCQHYGGVGPIRIPAQERHVAARKRMRLIRSLATTGMKPQELMDVFGLRSRWLRAICSEQFAWVGDATPQELAAFWHSRSEAPRLALKGAPPVGRFMNLENVSVAKFARCYSALVALTAALEKRPVGDTLETSEDFAKLVGFGVLPLLEELGLNFPRFVPTGEAALLFQMTSEALEIDLPDILETA